MSRLITAERLNVLRGQRTILNNVSLAVNEHDFITIIGPNGAGKSMLLKCLMGFYEPDSGTVSRREDIEIGYVPQSFTADRALPISVRRFLTLGRRLGGRGARDKIDEAGEETAILDLLERPLHVLSDGELQRVLLTRALLGDPVLLVLDEPAQNLDISGQLAFYKMLQRIYNERGLSILMVSHDLHLVMSCTRQVVCLFHHICCSGEPQAVAKDPEFISLFGDDMARMMAVYHHTHDHLHDHTHDAGGHDG